MPNTQNRRYINILQWNAGSVSPKRNQLFPYIENKNIDIVALSETWLSTNKKFVLPGFYIERNDRDDGYGVC